MSSAGIDRKPSILVDNTLHDQKTLNYTHCEHLQLFSCFGSFNSSETLNLENMSKVNIEDVEELLRDNRESLKRLQAS